LLSGEWTAIFAWATTAPLLSTTEPVTEAAVCAESVDAKKTLAMKSAAMRKRAEGTGGSPFIVAMARN
jgi:hypothetical protein